MLTCDIVRAHELTREDEAIWREFTASEEAFGSPLLSPEFFRVVAQVRTDACVAVFRRAGQTAGFLAHHRRPQGLARPIGAPFSDYTALITGPEPGFTIEEALASARIRRFQVIGLIDPFGLFSRMNGAADTAFRFDFTLPDTNVSGKRLKNMRRREEKLTEAHGPLRFHVGDRNSETFARMLEWKRAQTHQTGISDFLAPAWIQELMRMLFALPPENRLHGQMTSLYAGDRMVACKFGVRLGDYLHSWISTYDPALNDYSPGLLFLHHMREPMTSAGIRIYDMATGSADYKGVYCNDTRTVHHGRVYAASAEGQRDQAQAQRRTQIAAQLGERPAAMLDKLGRRLDQIAMLELDTPHRLLSVAQAFLSAPQRLKSSG